MKLAVKLVAIVVLEIVVLLAIDGYLTVQRETRLFQDDMRRDAQLMGTTLREFVSVVWRDSGREAALALLEQTNRGKQHPLTIRWVWLDRDEGPKFHPRAGAETISNLSDTNGLTLPVTARDGEQYLCTYVPVNVDGQGRGAIELAESVALLKRSARTMALRSIVLALTLVTAGGASVASLGVVLVGRPLHRLTEKARRVGQGDLSPSLVPRGRDELSVLTRSMNDMCRQLAKAHEQARIEQERRMAAMEQLRQTDRLRTVGRLAAGIAHELGTPLNTIAVRSSMISDGGLSEEEIAENARIVNSQCDRMTTIIRGLLDYARPRAPQRSTVDLRDVARDTIKLLAPLARKHGADIILRHSETACTAMVDAGQIQQVLTNLIVNAVQAEPAGGRQVEVDVARKDSVPPRLAETAPRHPFICVSIRDNGGGIAEEDLKNIFDPFFTTKEVGEGTGLGLSIVYGIVQEHGGWIDVTSRLGEGSCFAVFLPTTTMEGGI